MTHYIITYGCQMNKSDSERIAATLKKAGHRPASKTDEADLIVVNMCSIRQSAVDRVYGLATKFKKLKAKNSGIKIVLTGCVLKKDKKKFTKIFDRVIELKNLIKDTGPRYSNNFSAFIPIMRGCNNFCAYCVVPYTRDRETSRSSDEIICEIKNLVKKKYKEIWLLGQNVNSYGDIPFPRLLRKINKIPGDFWLRFTSSHPKDFSDELINAMAKCQKVTPYLNLPVQSGDNEILKRMNRPYTIEYYKKLVKRIRKKIPNITLSTDVIVGFPGETKKQFENTVNLFKEVKYDMAYISKYSPRPGTTAANMEDSVPYQEKKKRWKILTKILKETALENNKKYIGKTMDVLIDFIKPNFAFGKTQNFKTVKVKQRPRTRNYELKTGDIVKVKITKVDPFRLCGEQITKVDKLKKKIYYKK